MGNRQSSPSRNNSPSNSSESSSPGGAPLLLPGLSRGLSGRSSSDQAAPSSTPIPKPHSEPNTHPLIKFSKTDSRLLRAPTPFQYELRDLHRMHTYTYLTCAEIGTLSCVCVYFAKEMQNDLIWKRLLYRDFAVLRNKRDNYDMDTTNTDQEEQKLDHLNLETAASGAPSPSSSSSSSATSTPPPGGGGGVAPGGGLPVISSPSCIIRTPSFDRINSNPGSSTTPRSCSSSSSSLSWSASPCEEWSMIGSLASMAYAKHWSWSASDQPCKRAYEHECRRFYDPCLHSSEALANYIKGNRPMYNGLTAMCVNPAPGTEMEIKCRSLRLYWPDVDRAALHCFEYLRGFYFTWVSLPALKGRIAEHRQELEACAGFMGYSLQLTNEGEPVMTVYLRNDADVSSLATQMFRMRWLCELMGGPHNIIMGTHLSP